MSECRPPQAEINRLLLAEAVRLATALRALQDEVAALRKGPRERAYDGPALVPLPALPERPRISEILHAVAATHGVTVAEITARSRLQAVVAARHHAMHACRAAGFSLPRIGRALGGMDHSSVLHGCLAHAARVAGGEQKSGGEQKWAGKA